MGKEFYFIKIVNLINSIKKCILNQSNTYLMCQIESVFFLEANYKNNKILPQIRIIFYKFRIKAGEIVNFNLSR